ncbi:MAG: DUF3040 domain-containing protein [Actinobacteria bacterium]|nr:MAG: DUF3040 domain-containing protein [Actinomycetota bacterium]
MPLDDREQKILAEIERQFYEEDPELARAVQNIDKSSAIKVRLAVLGALVGLAVVLVFFAQNTILALVGFALLVASATVLVPVIRERLVPGETADDEPDQVT